MDIKMKEWSKLLKRFCSCPKISLVTTYHSFFHCWKNIILESNFAFETWKISFEKVPFIATVSFLRTIKGFLSFGESFDQMTGLSDKTILISPIVLHGFICHVKSQNKAYNKRNGPILILLSYQKVKKI